MQTRSAPVFEGFRIGEIQGVDIRDLRKFADRRGWLAELFRHDELSQEFYPAMTYISSTDPGMTRGPHEHVDQADFFCFIGPSSFKLRMWDNRKDSETYNHLMTLVVGENNPKVVLVPAGVVHAYQNVGEVHGIVINCPNRLFMGEGRREKIDEIRYEDDPDTRYRMEG